MKTATANFDCADIYQEHAFLVRLPKGRRRQVQVFEVFGRLPTEGEAQWAPENHFAVRGALLGKELLVLLWAIELPGVTPEEIAVAIRNWLGLKSEERWWLYTMTAAATGLSHQQGMGWRGALRQALCFGTRLDAFHLGAVAARGTLAPRANEQFAPEGKKTKRSQRKKTGADEPGFLFAPPPPAE